VKKALAYLFFSMLIFLYSCSTDHHIIWPQFNSKTDSSIHVKLLAINDFHGQLTFGNRTPVGLTGSAPVVDSYIKHAALKGENTFIINAGDLIGASTAASAILKDEPTIQFFNRLGNSECGCGEEKYNENCNLISIPGNHEFDAGYIELLRLMNGGTHKDGPYLEKHWKGAAFPLIASNIRYKSDGNLIFPPYIIKNVNGVKIAFIGAVYSETQSIVKNSDIDRLYFLDEADAINEFIPEIKSKGISAIIAIIHNGGKQDSIKSDTSYSKNSLSGPIVSILEKLDSEIDVVISAHTHSPVNLHYIAKKGNSFLVTQSHSKGMSYTDIDLVLDKESGEIIKKSAQIVMTYADKGPAVKLDPQIVAFTKKVSDHASFTINKIIGTADCNISRIQNTAGESALGNLVADAHREILNCDLAIVNLSGIRTNLHSGAITWSKLYYMQPNNNSLVKLTLTGRQVVDILNLQWINHRRRPCILQISGFSYTWDSRGKDSSRVIEVYKDGRPIDREAYYTVATTSFLADGGEKFHVFRNCRDRTAGPQDLKALELYISNFSNPLSIDIQNRIQKTISQSGS